MKCEDARAAISARFDGEEIGVDPQALEEHLAACAECRAESAMVGFSIERLRAIQIPALSPSFDDTVLGKAARKGWFDRLCDWFDPPARRVGAAAAFSGLLILSILSLPQKPGVRNDVFKFIKKEMARREFVLPGMLQEPKPQTEDKPITRSQRGESKCV